MFVLAAGTDESEVVLDRCIRPLTKACSDTDELTVFATVVIMERL